MSIVSAIIEVFFKAFPSMLDIMPGQSLSGAERAFPGMSWTPHA